MEKNIIFALQTFNDSPEQWEWIIDQLSEYDNHNPSIQQLKYIIERVEDQAQISFIGLMIDGEMEVDTEALVKEWKSNKVTTNKVIVDLKERMLTAYLEKVTNSVNNLIKNYHILKLPVI